MIRTRHVRQSPWRPKRAQHALRSRSRGLRTAARAVVGVAVVAGVTLADARQLADSSRPVAAPVLQEQPPAPDPPPAATTPKIVTTGLLVPAPGVGQPTGSGSTLTYRVEVETGVPVAPEDFAAAVEQTLSHEQGWTAVEPRRLQRVPDEADLSIVLASPRTTDELCLPAMTEGIYSCFSQGRAVVNAMRWLAGAATYDDLHAYRAYVINHEVGHGLGHPHRDCPAPGAPAPVMVQQTIGLQGCTPNPWPGVSE